MPITEGKSHKIFEIMKNVLVTTEHRGFFELFAIVELFGHTRVAGKVAEQSIGSASFIRIDIPETESNPKFTRIVHPNAVYAINPVTEEVMKAMAERLSQQPDSDFEGQIRLELK